jgi:hypothetical protein
MLRMSLAVAASVAAMSLATGADAFIIFNGVSTNLISYNGPPLAGQATDGALAGAKDADPRSTTAEITLLAVEVVILPTGETVDLR